MKTAILLCLLAASPAAAQSPAEKADEKPAEKSQPDNSEVCRNALKLVEVSGGKQRMQISLPQMIETAKAQMQREFPSYSAAFMDEWGKRMLTRIKVDEFAAVAAGVYAKYLTNSDILALIAAHESRKDSQPAALSTELQQRLTSLMPKIMGEIVGGCTELGAKIGGAVGREIETEHPELVPKPPDKKREQ